MKKAALYRSLTIVMPFVGVLCAAGASAYEWQRLKQLEGETVGTRSKLSQIELELRSYEAQPQMEKYPAVARTPREQALFLDTLRANADTCKVQLVRWSNTTAPAPTTATDNKNPGGLPPGVSAITSAVEVTGRSENTRQFLYNVVRSRRLLNMTDLKWVRDTWPNTHLTFTLTRYVAPPVQLPIERGHVDHADGDRNRSQPQAPTARSASPVSLAVRMPGPDSSGGISLPNPMDAPGIAHGAYQSRLDAGVSQLTGIDRTQSSASPRPPAVTDAKH